jgi:hypothetical protein
MNYRKQHIAGITIVEVLFSVGIIVTGLLGVAGLIMIAGAQMTQGLEADAMSNAGLNAITEFKTREMGRPDNLRWYNTSTHSFTPVLSNNLYGLGNEASPSFCIDPFFIAEQVIDRDQDSVKDNLKYHEYNRFPGIQADPANPNQIAPWQMRRVSLANPPGLLNVGYPLGTQNISNLLQSRAIFIAKDDIFTSKPTSATELPQQTWITNQAGNYVKRLNAAETSWMATLTPNRNRIMNVPARQYEPTDQYLLSIVIFNNRFINYIDDNTDPEKERLLKITFRNKGFGGGAVRLYHTDPAALELKHGDWLMLSAFSEIGACFRWYRISYIEDETSTTNMTTTSWGVIRPGEYYRNVTLQGPDWSRPEWQDTGTKTNPIPARFPTYVTYIPRVVGVFERTIRLESTSLY